MSNQFCIWSYSTSDNPNNIYNACQMSTVLCAENKKDLQININKLQNEGNKTFTSVNDCINSWNSSNHKPLYLVYQPESVGNCSTIVSTIEDANYTSLDECIQKTYTSLPPITLTTPYTTNMYEQVSKPSTNKTDIGIYSDEGCMTCGGG